VGDVYFEFECVDIEHGTTTAKFETNNACKMKEKKRSLHSKATAARRMPMAMVIVRVWINPGINQVHV
jgi:hypothetical protein